MSRGVTPVIVEEQRVQITDMTAFRMLIFSIVVGETVCLQLGNGECDVRVMGIVAHCSCCIDVLVQGMMGPKAVIRHISRNGLSINIALQCHNPSPVSIDHGQSLFELRNDGGQVLADLEGPFDLGLGKFEVHLHGSLVEGVEVGRQIRLVAVGTQCKTWCNETIQYIDIRLDLTPEQIGLLQSRG
jgi:hypothetical protein